MLISRKNLEGWCSGGCFNQRQAVRVRLGGADRSRRPSFHMITLFTPGGIAQITNTPYDESLSDVDQLGDTRHTARYLAGTMSPTAIR